MGTSTGYDMPTGGDWTPLKQDATRYVQSDGSSNSTPETVLANFVQALQNAAAVTTSLGAGSLGDVGGGTASGGGGGRQRTGGTTAISSGSAQRVGQRIGNFLSSVGASGLGTALQEIGLGALIGQSAAQIASALLDKLAGPASTIDDQAARLACDDLRKELLEGAKTAEDVETALKATLDASGLGGVLMRYFSLYIFRSFCISFYEVWVKKVGSAQASTKLSNIKKYVDTRLKAKMVNKDVTSFNWRGGEGGRLVSQILGETCRVFRVNPEGGAT